MKTHKIILIYNLPRLKLFKGCTTVIKHSPILLQTNLYWEKPSTGLSKSPSDQRYHWLLFQLHQLQFVCKNKNKKKERKLKEKRIYWNQEWSASYCGVMIKKRKRNKTRIRSTVVFCIWECFSLIFTRCNPMPTNTTRCKMVACCFLCANWISLFSEFLEFADAWY